MTDAGAIGWIGLGIAALVAAGALMLFAKLVRQAPEMDETPLGLRPRRAERLRQDVLRRLGGGLRAAYGRTLAEPIPAEWAALAERLPASPPPPAGLPRGHAPKPQPDPARPQASGDAPPGPAPQPVATAPRASGRVLLLYCPGEGGWQAGTWQDGRWTASGPAACDLHPTHWSEPPPVPGG